MASAATDIQQFVTQWTVGPRFHRLQVDTLGMQLVVGGRGPDVDTAVTKVLQEVGQSTAASSAATAPAATASNQPLDTAVRVLFQLPGGTCLTEVASVLEEVERECGFHALPGLPGFTNMANSWPTWRRVDPRKVYHMRAAYEWVGVRAAERLESLGASNVQVEAAPQPGSDACGSEARPAASTDVAPQTQDAEAWPALEHAAEQLWVGHTLNRSLATSLKIDTPAAVKGQPDVELLLPLRSRALSDCLSAMGVGGGSSGPAARGRHKNGQDGTRRGRGRGRGQQGRRQNAAGAAAGTAEGASGGAAASSWVTRLLAQAQGAGVSVGIARRWCCLAIAGPSVAAMHTMRQVLSGISRHTNITSLAPPHMDNGQAGPGTQQDLGWLHGAAESASQAVQQASSAQQLVVQRLDRNLCALVSVKPQSRNMARCG